MNTLSSAALPGFVFGNLAEPEWVDEAAAYQNALHNPGDPGYALAADLIWYHVEQYPIARIIDAPDADWFADECACWAADGYPNRFDDMLTRAIVDPIIVYDDGHAGHLWDGNHRIGATIVKGLTTLRAVVGVRRA